MKVTLDVNGAARAVDVRPGETLYDTLTQQLELCGPKRGCDNSGCGCCTVLLNGSPVYSCMVFAGGLDGSRVLTLEGGTSSSELAVVQEALVTECAVQCGYCMSGMAMVATWLLTTNATPDEATIREAIAGNICRCTGYAKIVNAIQRAAGRR